MKIFARNVIGVAAALAGIGSAALASDWVVDAERSSLIFEVETTVLGKDDPVRFAAEVPNWTAQIRFDPESPCAAVLVVEIDPAAIHSGDPWRDDNMKGPDWLAVSAHPAVWYKAEGFTRDGAAWRADGALTLRGETETTPLIFEIEIEGDAAHAWGEAIVLRERFGVGAETGAGMAASEVQVSFDIWAARGE